jgi:hypothetical protein
MYPIKIFFNAGPQTNLCAFYLFFHVYLVKNNSSSVLYVDNIFYSNL